MKTDEQTELMNRAGTIEAALAYLGDQDDEVIRYKKLISVFDDPTDHLVNYQTAVVLVRAMNEKCEPDWDNEDEWKYHIWFELCNHPSFLYYAYDVWHSISYIGSRLCLFDRAQADWLAERHLDVFKNFLLITKKQQDNGRN